jgi:hypothetical protein
VSKSESQNQKRVELIKYTVRWVPGVECVYLTELIYAPTNQHAAGSGTDYDDKRKLPTGRNKRNQ